MRSSQEKACFFSALAAAFDISANRFNFLMTFKKKVPITHTPYGPPICFACFCSTATVCRCRSRGYLGGNFAVID